MVREPCHEPCSEPIAGGLDLFQWPLLLLVAVASFVVPGEIGCRWG